MHLVIRGRGLVILFLVLLIAVGFGVLVKPAGAINNQVKAGQLISQVASLHPEITACESPVISDQKDIEQLQVAIRLLHRSIDKQPDNAQSYLHLGHAYCLLGQYTEAVEAFKNYIRIRPANPLGHLELGFAEQAQCSSEELSGKSDLTLPQTEIGRCHDDALMQQILRAWQQFDFNSDQFLAKAQKFFSENKYADAAIWYSRAAKFQLASLEELSIPDQYKWAISQIVASSTFPEMLTGKLPIVEIMDSTIITADQLHMLREIPGKIRYGDNISLRKFSESTAGIIYWSGPAGVLVSIPDSGWYQLSLNAQNNPPAPIILQLEDNFQSLGKIELNRGDQSWESFQFKVHLQQGIHLLDIKFTNDGLVNGIDRNAIIEWLKIESTG